MGKISATKPDQNQGNGNESPVEAKPCNQLKSLFRNPIVKSDFFQLKANAFFEKNTENYKGYDGGHHSRNGGAPYYDGSPHSQQAATPRRDPHRDPHRDPRCPPKNRHEGSRRRSSVSCDASMEYNDRCRCQPPDSEKNENRYNDRYHNPPPDSEMRDKRHSDRRHSSHPQESEIRDRCCCDSNKKKPVKHKPKPQPRDPPPYELSCRRKSIPPARNESCHDVRHPSPQPHRSRREREVYSDSSYCYGGPCRSRHAERKSSPAPPAKPQPKARRSHSLSDCESKPKKRHQPRQPADCATDYMEYRDFKTLAHYSPLVVKSPKSPPKPPPKDKRNNRSRQVSRKSSKVDVCDCHQELEYIHYPCPSQRSHSYESLPPPPPPKHYPVNRSASGYKICRDSNCFYKNYPQSGSNRNELSKQASYTHYSPDPRGQVSPQNKYKSPRTSSRSKSQRGQSMNTDHVGPLECLCHLGSNGARKKASTPTKRGGGGISNRESCRPRHKNRLPAGSPSCSKRASCRDPTELTAALKRKSLFSSALTSSRNHPLPFFSSALVRKTSSMPTILKFFKMRRIPHLKPSCNRIRGGKLTPVNKNIRPTIVANNRTVDVQSTTMIQGSRRQTGVRSSSVGPRRSPPTRSKIRNRSRAPSAPPATRVTRSDEVPTTSGTPARQRTAQLAMAEEEMQQILSQSDRFRPAENVELPTQSIGLMPGMESFYRGSFLAIRACALDDAKGQEQPKAHYSSLTLATPPRVVKQDSFDQVTENLRKEFEKLIKSRSASSKNPWTWLKMLPKRLFTGKKSS